MDGAIFMALIDKIILLIAMNSFTHVCYALDICSFKRIHFIY